MDRIIKHKQRIQHKQCPVFAINQSFALQPIDTTCGCRKHTNVRLFFCQCNNCSCCVRFGVEGRLLCLPLSIEGLMFLPPPLSSSLRSGKLLLSRGLHNPKSESFIWPLRSSNKLSGLISLQRKDKEYKDVMKYNLSLIFLSFVCLQPE